MKRICLLFVILLFPITTFSHISEIKSIRDNFARFSNTSSSAVENYKYFASNYRSTDIRENLAEKPFSGMVSDEFLAAPPTITTSVTTLAAFTSCIQTTSESQYFTISGNFLTSGIVVTATVGFEVSMDNSAFSSSVLFAETGGIVPTSIVYVRMSPTTSAVSGTISLTSAAAVTQTVSVSGAVGATTTWNGTSWNPIAPNSTMMAVISGNYSQSADINACYLTVTNGAVVSIPSGYIVTLSGALTVESGTSFTLQNNAGLIQSGTTNPNSGDITVKRNSSFIKRMDYTLWSSPTFGPQSLQAFAIGTLPARFYTYKTSTNLYSTVLSPSTTNFATAKGYRIRTSNAHSITGAIWTGAFLGRPNSGDITVEMENDGPTFAFNCVGNPYPSPINATTFV